MRRLSYMKKARHGLEAARTETVMNAVVAEAVEAVEAVAKACSANDKTSRRPTLSENVSAASGSAKSNGLIQ